MMMTRTTQTMTTAMMIWRLEEMPAQMLEELEQLYPYVQLDGIRTPAEDDEGMLIEVEIAQRYGL